MTQLPAPVLNGQSEEDPQKDPKAHKTRAEPPELVPVPVKKHTMLFQASNNDQLGFQKSPWKNQSEEDGPIAGTGGLKLCVLIALVRKAAIPKTAYDETPKSLVTLLWEAQQGDTLVDTQRRLLADKANCPAKLSVASNWAILDGILRYKGRINVPNSALVWAEILLRNYDDPHAGHFGAHKTLELLQRKYFWPRMAKDVKKYVKDCKTCNCTKATRHKPYGLLQLLPAPSGL